MSAPVGNRAAHPAATYLAGLSALALTAVGLIAALLKAGSLPAEPLSSTSAEAAASALSLCVVIAVAIGSWWLVEFRPGVGAGLCWVGLGGFVPQLASWTDLPARVRAESLAATPLGIAGVAAVLTAWATPTARGRAWLGATAGLAALATTLRALGYDPFGDPGCSQVCEPVPPIIHAGGVREVLGVSTALTVVAAIAALIVALSTRTVPVSVRLAAGAAIALLTVATAGPWLRWGSTSPSSTDEAPRAAAVAVLTFAVLVALAKVWRIRRGLAGVTEYLGGKATDAPDGLVRAVHFAVPGEGRWTDRAGRPAPDREVPSVILGADSDVAVRLVLSRRREQDEIAGAITPVGRMALENSRLDAVNRARLAQVQASQQRIVAASDTERRRVERDLHDGAQQRLVSVAMHLRLALARAGAAKSAALTAADRHLQSALDGLRTIAHGSFPDVLAAEGLAAAVEDLAASAPLPVSMTFALPDNRLPDQVEMTVYVTAAAAVRGLAEQEGATRMSITMSARSGMVTLSVAGDGHGEIRVPTEVGDRIGAVGGTLDIASSVGSGTIVTVVIPCEW